MQTFTAYDGSAHPVRDDFLIFPAGWSDAEESDMLARWRGGHAAYAELIKPRLFPLSPRRRAELEATVMRPFSQRDRDLLHAWDNRTGINATLVLMAKCGADYRALGFETVCQPHGNWNERPCGCKFYYLIDHHRRSMPPRMQIRIPIWGEVCPDHCGFNSLESAFFAPERQAAAG